MPDRESVRHVIYAAIDEHNEAVEAPARLAKSEDTVLFGRGGSLDSVGLVSLIVGVEQGIEERFGVCMTLADERAMSQKSSPFRSVRALTEYVHACLEESAGP
jgi:acyl carrier protein